ncbi:MAG: hypothetical protein MZV70_06115 [Desulfobacterales bacterium]|nr:hypothetical protein [Desulfobacterales bacterium]
MDRHRRTPGGHPRDPPVPCPGAPVPRGLQPRARRYARGTRGFFPGLGGPSPDGRPGQGHIHTLHDLRVRLLRRVPGGLRAQVLRARDRPGPGPPVQVLQVEGGDPDPLGAPGRGPGRPVLPGHPGDPPG